MSQKRNDKEEAEQKWLCGVGAFLCVMMFPSNVPQLHKREVRKIFKM